MSIIDDIKGSKITFVKSGVKKAIDISELFDIDEEDLTHEFAQQASLYAYFATLQAEAELELSHAALAKDQEYAACDEHHRKALDRREQKYTEAVIKSLVVRDQEYNDVYDRHAACQNDVEVIKAIVKALQMRAEMLISLGAHMRQEYSMTGMNIREKAYEKAVDAAKSSIRSKRAS